MCDVDERWSTVCANSEEKREKDTFANEPVKGEKPATAEFAANSKVCAVVSNGHARIEIQTVSTMAGKYDDEIDDSDNVDYSDHQRPQHQSCQQHYQQCHHHHKHHKHQKLPQQCNSRIGKTEYDFDPYEYRNEKNATSFWGTVMHLIVIGTSPTLLSLPATFDKVGYVIGICGSFSTVLLYAYCMHMIVDGEYVLCKRIRQKQMSYTQVVYHAFATGPHPFRWMAVHARRLLYVTLLSIWAGGNAIYVILISANLKSSIKFFMRYDEHDLNDRTIILYLIVPLVLLCWIPNLRLLVICSVFSNVVNVCSILIVLFVASQDLAPLAERVAIGDPTKIPYFLGVIFVTINGTGLLMSLKNQMRNPKKFKSKAGVLNISYVTTGVMYAFFGFVCYLKFGPDTDDNVIFNLADNEFTNVVKVLFALAVIFFYPLASYVAFDIVWNESLKEKFDKKSAYKNPCKYVVKTANALSSIVMAYVFPDISIFVSLTGTVCASLDSIILPAIINILIYSHDWRPLQLSKNIVVIILGVICMVAGLFYSIKELNDYY